MSAASATRPPARRPPRRAPTVLQRIVARLAAIVTGVRNGWTRARSGQRPLVGVLMVALVGSVVLVSGPAERYLDGRERVEGLRSAAAVLDEEIAVLEARIEALDDPRRIEVLAREQQGMVRPGEVPYTILPPETDRPRIADARADAAIEPDLPWYGRAWQRVRSWF